MTALALEKEPTLMQGGGSPMDPLPPEWDMDDMRPFGFCGLCDAAIWREEDAYGPYRNAAALGIVCGDCAPRVTRGVL